jgi:Fe-S cluster biosynthesis and repair protein YggX
MSNAAKRISSIIGGILVIIIIALLFYMDWSRKSNEKQAASNKTLTEAEKLLERDLDQNYPETPREVAKYYSSITKALYSGLKDDEVEALAKRILLLYDEEFLQYNPEDKYLKDLYSDIAAWNNEKRKITNYLLVNEDKEEKVEMDGREFATVYVSYFILEEGKASETRKFLMRKSEDGKWKILGWEVTAGDES